MVKKKAPLIVKEGTVYRTLDIVRSLLTLDAVQYKYVVEGLVVSEGKGWIVRVFYSHDSASLVVNNCLFINVRSFDYLKFSHLDDNTVEMILISENSELKLQSLGESIKPPRAVERLRRLEDEEFEFQFYRQDHDDD